MISIIVLSHNLEFYLIPTGARGIDTRQSFYRFTPLFRETRLVRNVYGYDVKLVREGVGAFVLRGCCWYGAVALFS